MNRSSIETNILNNIKTLTLDMIYNAKLDNTNINLDTANILYTLYANHLNINVNDSIWLNRDRFIMSSSINSAFLYSTLFMADYLNIDDLKSYTAFNSKTPYFLNHEKTKGVEFSNGAIGQEVASAVGMALASKKINYEIRKPKTSILEAEHILVDNKIYVLCTTQDLMEGITNEAMSFAGELKLDNLIVLCENTNDDSKEVITQKYKAMNWNTIKINNNISSIDKAISKAKNSKLPTIIEIVSTNKDDLIKKDSLLENSDLIPFKQKLNIPTDIPFFVDNIAKETFTKKIYNHTSLTYSNWSKHYQEFKSEEMVQDVEKYNFLFFKPDTYNFSDYDFHFESDYKEDINVINNKIMNEISKSIFSFVGGYTTELDNFKTDSEIITESDYSGNNINFKNRENAMGAILNGMSFYNYKLYGITDLTKSDYLKPSIRMSALLNKPINYVFTTSDIYSPMSQSIEQLENLRSIPNLFVYRPCDINELIGCWNVMLNSDRLNALVLTNKKVNAFGSKENVKYGAYMIKEETKRLQGIIIATGSEVETAIHIAEELDKQYNLGIRVVSMPSKDLFDLQNQEYKTRLLPIGIKKIFIEASTHKEEYCYNINLNKFGISGGKDEYLKTLYFDYNTIKNKVLNYLKTQI